MKEPPRNDIMADFNTGLAGKCAKVALNSNPKQFTAAERQFLA